MSELVGIGRVGKKQTLLTAVQNGPIADKFFLVGVLVGFFGSAYLGIHMWLMKHGVMNFWVSYADLRTLHINLQIFAFFGLFILGFTIQAFPKLIGAGNPPSSRHLFLALLPPAGCLLLYLFPGNAYGSLFISIPFLLMATRVIVTLPSCPDERRYSIAVPVALGLLTLGVGAFLELSRAETSFFVFWAGITPIILGAGQQFISGFMGGRIMPRRYSLTFLLLFFLSVVFVLTTSSEEPLFSLTGVLALLVYFTGTDLYKMFFRAWRTPLEFAFGIGFVWLVAGILILPLEGFGVDQSLHALAIGWGIPITLAVSSQIMGFLIGSKLFSEGLLILLILLWQWVPADRVLSLFPARESAIANSVLVTFILGAWVIQALRAEFRLLRRQIGLKGSEKMVTC